MTSGGAIGGGSGRPDAGAPHMTRPLGALGHDFTVRTADAEFGRWLDRTLASLRSDGDPASYYEHTIERTTHRLRYVGDGTDEIVVETSEPAVVLGYLVWHVNRAVVAAAQRDAVVVHAAGAVRDGVGMLLPGPMEAGKSTLVAGLVRAGCGYLSDEAVAIAPGSLLMQPFPRPLSLDPGSCAVLGDIPPAVPAGVAAYLRRQRQVPVSDLGAEVAGPTRAGVIVRPRYRAGAPTTVEAVSRAQMLRVLAEQTFGLGEQAERALPVLAGVVRGAACHRLTFSDLDDACRCVAGLVEVAVSAGDGA